ncbi:MAG: transcription initiation protein [Gemmatimonadales bacterium]
MPLFVTIGYGDQRGYDRTPQAIRDAAHKHDETLQMAGVLMGIAGSPVQVRNLLNARVETTNGAYMTSSLPIAGFAIVEAASLSDAVDLVSKSPCAVAHGVVEIWPLQESP